jgi:hypothetical protein
MHISLPLSLGDEITMNQECFRKPIAQRDISAWRQQIELQNARLPDNLAELFNRMMQTHRPHGREALALDRLKRQEKMDSLIHRLHEVVLAWSLHGPNDTHSVHCIGTNPHGHRNLYPVSPQLRPRRSDATPHTIARGL